MDNGNIEKNVKQLLDMRGMSQEDLAKILNVEPHTVNQWLNKRHIPDEYLNKIANEFEVSVSILKNNDVDLINNMGKLINDDEFFKKLYKVLFPFMNKETNNESFRKAYNLHIKISEMDYLYDEELFHKKVDECFMLYTKAYDDGISESLVNMLSINSIYKYLIKTFNFNGKFDSDDNKLIDDFNNISERKRKEIINKVTIFNDNEKKKEAKDYISSSTNEILNMLLTLKKYPEYRDLYDYYIAILFSLNMIDFSIEESKNVLFGETYLSVLATLGNEYALNYLELEKSMIK